MGKGEIGARVRNAFEGTLKEGRVLTRDLGGSAGTDEFTNAIIAKL
jgi:isocitrate/isopropylmalate dehydrogenase